MTRTDVHRPSAINVDDYEFVGFEVLKIDGLGAAEAQLAERAKIEAHKARTGGAMSTHEHGGNCMVCGNVMATYTILWYHAKSNTYVRTGQDCAAKIDMGYDADGWNQFVLAVRDARQAQAGKRKAELFLVDAGLARAWDLYGAEYSDAWRNEELTVRDIVGKLVRYGSISEKQVAFLRTLLDRIDRRAEIEAQRAAETEAAAPCPSGRMEITGTVLTTKVQASDFSRFGVLKMLVKADSGFKVWGSVPGSASIDGLVGSRVVFTANVEPSKNDPKFGFFKRPFNLRRAT